MKALSRESTDLIDAARRGEPKLTTTSRAASRAKILARVGVAAGAAGIAAGASTAAATTAGALGAAPVAAAPIAATMGVSLVAKIGLSLVVLAGAVGGVVALTRPSAPSAPADRAPVAIASTIESPRAKVSSLATPPSLDAAPPVSAAPSATVAPSAPTAAPPSAEPTSSAASSTAADPLASENELIARAQRALASGQAGQALAALDEHARRFPSGMLAPEREAARALALCAAGRTSEGRAAAAPFVKDDADSPIAKRIRSACGM